MRRIQVILWISLSASSSLQTMSDASGCDTERKLLSLGRKIQLHMAVSSRFGDKGHRIEGHDPNLLLQKIYRY